MRDLDTIVERWRSLRVLHADRLQQNRLIDDLYHGKADLPLPELEEREKSAVINFFTKGVDSYATRVASNPMNLSVASAKPGVKVHDDRARNKRRALYGMWEHSNVEELDFRHARNLIAHSCAPMVIRPDFEKRTPVWRIRNPLGALPAPTADPNDPHPPYTVFELRRSWGWLRSAYPEAASMVARPSDVADEAMFTVIEHIDADETVMAVVGGTEGWTTIDSSDGRPYSGRRNGVRTSPRWSGTSDVVQLEWMPNRAGVPLAVVADRITLGDSMGQFDSLVGSFFTRALLMALEVRAVKEAVYPQQWLEETENSEGAEIVQMPNPMRGIIGKVTGGRINTVELRPGYQTYPTVDRLERSERVEGGIPSDMTGESPTNVRTGRRGDAIMAATVDFSIMEAQRVLARAREVEDRVAIAVDRSWFGNDRKSFYVDWKGEKGRVDYVPSELWDSDEHRVRYSHPGSDQNGLVISLGQRLQMRTISARTFMELDPVVEDPESERDRIMAEQLREAAMSALLSQAADGAIPINDVARIAELVETDRLEVHQAVLQVQREAQERQAEVVPPGAPEAQPGLAQPGMGAESASQAPPVADVGQLAQMAFQLRAAQREAPQESAFNAAAGA